MIYDHINNLGTYKGLHPNLDQALDFLSQEALQNLELGRHTIDGDSVFALIQDNQLNQSESPEFEYHRSYLDLHLLLDGQETIIYGFGDRQSTKDYDEVQDFGFETCERHLKMTIDSQHFVIFYPGEAHQPNVYAGAGDAVKKCVVKVFID
ncbi:YhcH/YjgK/YiaL family protein [Streptococcus ovuberis]|uniref:DUF386 family protein n=1 Tax=Streptococcus ovuberis TaxID=1936207 RepID=A0A7X6S1I7_9STRE|nr:YhcH/YjgK/YiaL family protein [Streptococcus ovuberis]NKZ21303.1 DUF386 family protein [Streptococcus ovuberis]